MNTELTVELVKYELKTLIEKYPDNTGAVKDPDGYDEDDKKCVYYLDETGFPVTSDAYAEYEDRFYNDPFTEPIQLATPVCIVGHWVEEFHPELKEDRVIRGILLRNSIIANGSSNVCPIPVDVLNVLGKYQSAQDSPGVPSWEHIEGYLADESTDYYYKA